MGGQILACGSRSGGNAAVGKAAGCGAGQSRSPKGSCGAGLRTCSANGAEGAKDSSVMPTGRAGPSRRWEGCPRPRPPATEPCRRGRPHLRGPASRGRIPSYAARAFRRGQGWTLPAPGAPPRRSARPSRAQRTAIQGASMGAATYMAPISASDAAAESSTAGPLPLAPAAPPATPTACAACGPINASKTPRPARSRRGPPP